MEEDLRIVTKRKIEEIKNSETLTPKEKNQRILKLASELGKKLLEDDIKEN